MLKVPAQFQVIIFSCALLAGSPVAAVDAEHDAHPHTQQDEGGKGVHVEHEPMDTPASDTSASPSGKVKTSEPVQETKKKAKKKKKKKKKALKKKHKCQKKKLKKKQKEEKEALKKQQQEEDKALEREGPPEE